MHVQCTIDFQTDSRDKIRDECDVCGVPKIIEHLLFSFTYVKPLWRVVQFVFDLFITFETLTTKHSLFSSLCCLVCVSKSVCD